MSRGHLLPWALTQSSVFMSQVHWTKGPDDSQHQSRSVQLEGGRRKAKGGNRVEDWDKAGLLPGNPVL